MLKTELIHRQTVLIKNNERILQMNASGVSIKEIAKKLNMGVGEVRLVINLYKGGKQQ